MAAGRIIGYLIIPLFLFWSGNALFASPVPLKGLPTFLVKFWQGYAGNEENAFFLRNMLHLAGFLSILITEICRRASFLKIQGRMLIRKTGLIFSSRTEINIMNIRTMEVQDVFPLRLFGFGTLRIASSGTSDWEIEIHDLQFPSRIAKEIQIVVDKENEKKSESQTPSE